MEKELYELTAPQKSIYVTEQYYNGSTINNICGTADIKEEIDFNLLKQAITLFVQYNENFNLKLCMVNNEVKQYVDDFDPFDIPIIDVKNTKEILKLEETEANIPFNLSSNLFSFKIFRLPNNFGGFIANLHHLISDSWTLGLLGKNILRIYYSLKNEESIDTNAFPSYVDYILSESQYHQSDKFKKDKEYWNSLFTTIPALVNIPSTHVKLASLSCKANRLNYTIPKEEMSKINEFCKTYHISVFNFFMAIYAIYIGRVSLLDDFVIGTPILNRTNFKEKNTTGMFINIIPMRIQIIDGNFISLVQKIAKDSISMLRHQKYSYQYLLENLRDKNPDLPALYNTIISYQITKTNTENDISYETHWNFNGNCADPLDIHLFDLNDLGSINIAYDYQLDQYTQEDITSIHFRILHIIRQVLSFPEINLKEISIVTSKEKYELLYRFNNTDVDYLPTTSFISLFEEQVEKTPDSPALTFEEKTLTYQELNQKANSLAYMLREHKVINNTIVAIMMNRSLEMIVSILAVLKAGGAYIPIDPEYPDERINYMLNDSKTKILLTTKHLNKQIVCEQILLADLENAFYQDHLQNMISISRPEDLSYIIYTSGSTGNPKGVMLTQRNLTNFYYAMKEKISYLQEENSYHVASITTVSFDIFGFETLISLATGNHLFMTNYFEQKITNKLETFVVNNKIDIIQTTPSVMRFHLDNLENKSNFTNLKYIILAGELLPSDLVKQIHEIAPDCIIYNGYGPSETTIFSTLQDVTNEDTITIGKPIANTQIYILDENHNLLPKHHIGEIYISGNGVGKGYLGHPELTQKNFLPNPFNNNSLLYKTGDLGAWQNDGCIECKGRVDHQVKLHGLRIELDEIEERINSFLPNNELKSIVAVKKIDAISSKDSLVAFLVCKTNILESSLRSYLLESLPNYMIPQHFLFLEDFPYTPNGKIDRKALLKLEFSTHQKAIVPPQSDFEKRLYEIISKLTKNSEFSMDDDFFGIGMDSLDMIKLSSFISSTYHIEVPITQFYKLCTVSNLAKYIQESSNIISHLPKAKKKDFYALSSAQKRIYYECRKLGENSLVYNISGGVLFPEVLDLKKVETSFNTIIKQNVIFQSCFKLIGGTPYQVLNDFSPIKVNYGAIIEENEVKDIVQNFPHPFSLETAPLLRVSLFRVKNGKTLLLIDSHHIVLDGTSLSILIDNFCKLYQGKIVVPSAIDYIDYSEFENSNSYLAKVEQLDSYWKKQFEDSDIIPLSLPYDYSIPSLRTYKGDTISTTIPEELFDSLQKLSTQLGISPYLLFLSAFCLLLYRYTGQEQIVLGCPINGRDFSELQSMLGMFVNNFVLKTTLLPNNTFEEFVQTIKQTVNEDLAHQPYPFDRLVEVLNPSTPLIDVLFTYQNIEQPSYKGLNIIPCVTHTSKYNLSMEIIPNSRIINLEYATDLFKRDTIEKMLEHFSVLLTSISQNPKKIISNLEIISEEEKRKIIGTFNNNTITIPEDKNLIDLFNQITKNYPLHTAVSHHGYEITYRELNEMSNQLAYELIQNGINSGDVVGVLLNKSIELVISIWAILKIGATYLPIYTGYPKDRINYMLNNSNSKIVITNSNFKDMVDIEIPNFILNSYHNLKTLKEFNFKDTIFPSNLAYIIYTSGSTGKPKGVKITHQCLINFISAFNHYYPDLNENDVVLSSTNISFDVSIWELFLSILNGAKLVLNEEEIINDINIYCNTIIKNNITTLYIPPNILKEVYSILKQNSSVAIRHLLVGVEPISKNTIDLYYELNSHIKIINGYGPTETTICCSALSYHKDNTSDGFLSIGKPLCNNNIYILDKNKNLCPIGVIGYLYVTGLGVGAGYINNLEETSKNFLENTMDCSSQTMYYTGDLAKWNVDGTITFIGRKDSQVKISGYRIELNEITSTLLQHPYVEKCVIIPNANKTHLACFYVSDKIIPKNDLLTFLQEKLAFYMIPKTILQISNFPLTANGKLDTKKLLEMIPTHSENYIAPITDTQIKLCHIWQTLFSLDKVGISDNFFELGGDSLLAIKFQTEALKLGLNISYSDIFAYPTIQQLSSKDMYVQEDILDYNYDYTKIHELLCANKLDNIAVNNSSPKQYLKGILLLGSTGYLGAHILSELLDSTDCPIYCLVRMKNSIEPDTRLRKTLHFYFGNKYDNLISSRIHVLLGDITKPDLDLAKEDYSILNANVDVVINSAALVKHFGNYSTFNTINVEGTKHLVAFCKNYHKKLYHISTISVSGVKMLNEKNQEQISFKETDFYINQSLNNIYIRTKFEAEKIIYEEILNGLDACVLRVGNITNRYTDGKFQMNLSENAFVNQVKSICNLGFIQDKFLEHYLELTPVDFCAKAIIALLLNQPNFCTFHLFNTNLICFSKLLDFINDIGISVHPVSDEVFVEKINYFLNDENLKKEISGIVTYLDKDKTLNIISDVVPNGNFSTTYLKSIGFEWPQITKEYITLFFKYFRSIHYFN